MRVIEPGHTYQLTCFDGFENLFLTFMKREGINYPGNMGAHPGTNCQEVLRALIDRVKGLTGQAEQMEDMLSVQDNEVILTYLRLALLRFEKRAARRHGRILPAAILDDRANIEHAPTCEKCGHIGCAGSCHK